MPARTHIQRSVIRSDLFGARARRCDRVKVLFERRWVVFARAQAAAAAAGCKVNAGFRTRARATNDTGEREKDPILSAAPRNAESRSGPGNQSACDICIWMAVGIHTYRRACRAISFSFRHGRDSLRHSWRPFFVLNVFAFF